MPRISYINGKYVPHHLATVGVEDRGLQFADSVYEVVALIDGKFADMRGHLDRLERSLRELRIDMPMRRKALEIAMRHLVSLNRIKNGGLYIQVTRGEAARDFKFPKDTAPTLIMTLRSATFDIEARKSAAKKVITVPDIRWQRRDIKTTGLLAQVLAKQTALDAKADDAWMFDDKGMINEASASNAWIVDKKGNLITRPTKENKILKGVTRSALQSFCKGAGIKLVERPFSVKEAKAAKEAFMSSAVALIVPVSHIDGVRIGDGKIGPVTSKIFDLYMNYAPTETNKQIKWVST